MLLLWSTLPLDQFTKSLPAGPLLRLAVLLLLLPPFQQMVKWQHCQDGRWHSFIVLLFCLSCPLYFHLCLLEERACRLPTPPLLLVWVGDAASHFLSYHHSPPPSRYLRNVCALPVCSSPMLPPSCFLSTPPPPLCSQSFRGMHVHSQWDAH